MNITADEFPVVSGQRSGIDGRPVFDDDVARLHGWKVGLENIGGIVEGDRNDFTAGALRRLEAAPVELGQIGVVPALVACSFREDKDGNALFDVGDRFLDHLQSFFQVISVQEQAEEKFHIPGEQRYVFEVALCDIAAAVFHLAVADDDVEEAQVVSHEQDGLVLGNIVQADHGDLCPADKQENFKSALHNAQHGQFRLYGIKLPDQGLNQKKRHGQDTVDNNKYNGNQCSKHLFCPFPVPVWFHDLRGHRPRLFQSEPLLSHICPD